LGHIGTFLPIAGASLLSFVSSKSSFLLVDVFDLYRLGYFLISSLNAYLMVQMLHCHYGFPRSFLSSISTQVLVSPSS